MKKFTILKTIYFFFFLTILTYLCGCGVTTKGLEDRTLQSQEPYVFEYDGTFDDLFTLLKRELFLNGFMISYENKEDGIISTEYKLLSEDESYQIGVGLKVMVGMHSDKQYGRLVFMLMPPENNKVQFHYFGKLTVDAKVLMNNYQSQDLSAENILIQGHPFLMKYREKIRKIPNMKLLTEIQE